MRYQKNPQSKAIRPGFKRKTLHRLRERFGLLGTNHSFETRIYLDGQLADGILNGDVNLVCEHDITWNPAVFPSNAAAPLQYIAAQLKAKGLKKRPGQSAVLRRLLLTNPDGNSRMPQS